MLAFNAAPILHPLWTSVPPAEAVLLLALAAGLAAMARLGPAEPPPSAEVTTAAIFALHGHV